MYRTEKETTSTYKGLITIQMDEEHESVRVYVREAADSIIQPDAFVNMPPADFFDLVDPILHARGYRVRLGSEVV